MKVDGIIPECVLSQQKAIYQMVQGQLITLIIMLLCLSACSKKSDLRSEGYIEGTNHYLSSRFQGKLTELSVDRGSSVKKGQLLFRLEAEPERTELEVAQQQINQSQAMIQQVDASLAFLKGDVERKKILLKNGSLQKSAFDSVQSNYDRNIARRSEAIAELAVAKSRFVKATWAVAQKTISSPANGIVFDTYYSPGENVMVGQPILSLLAPENIKAIFFVPEAELSNLKLGDDIDIEMDGIKDHINAKVSYISSQAEYTPPVIFSKETRNNLIFRVEARFENQIAMRLHPGQPISVFVHPHD